MDASAQNQGGNAWTFREIFEETDKQGMLMMTTPDRRSRPDTKPEETLILYSLAYMKAQPGYEQEKKRAADSGLGDLEQSPYWLVGSEGTYAPVADERSLVAAVPDTWSVNKIYSMSPHAWRERQSKELRERIRDSLNKPLKGYELDDKSTKTVFRFPTASEAIATADEMGRDSLWHRDLKRIHKIDGQWYVEGGRGKTLADAQDAIDRDALYSIKNRAGLRAEIEQGLDAKIDREMAKADAIAFCRIDNERLQVSAAIEMANNARKYPEYKVGLDKAIPAYPDTAEKVYALDASYDEKIAAKAQRDGLDVMTVSQADFDRLAAVRARDTAQAREALDLNTVEPNAERKRQPLPEAQNTPSKPQADKARGGNRVESDEIFTATQRENQSVVPPEVEKRYIHVGNKFYYPKNTDLVAFEDKGNKLETKSNSETIAESLVRIAEARGWDEIKVSGSETFRREVWLKAASRGMHVKGYMPSEQDKALLAQRLNEIDTNQVKENGRPFRARENADENIGEAKPAAPMRDSVQPGATLIAHGAAKYKHDAKNSGSYYVTTRDEQGREKTHWGIDLERAMSESGAQVGDRVSIVHEGKKTVTIQAPVYDSGGNLIGYEEKNTHRNTWNVQRANAFRNSPENAVKTHPELAGAAAALASIEKKAEADGLSAQQRAVVMARVRENVVNSIERGEIPAMNMRKEMKREQELAR
ncbi:MAG: hypothetical protein LBP86_03750 [Azoarcus sp.]|jgi:hypothetical protein|nr:hypothetical protein [Azoarcus sp.]